MQYEAPKNAIPERISIHRNMNWKDYGVMVGLTLGSLPRGWYVGIR